MSNLKRSGGCHCGAVTFEVTLHEEEVHVCHCGICQKWGGNSGLALACDKDWTIKGEENLKWYASTEWAKRGFCSKCGTHLLFKMNDASYHGIPAGALDSQEGLKLGMHIFIDKKPDYYDFADDCKRLTEKEFLEMVGAAE